MDRDAARATHPPLHVVADEIPLLALAPHTALRARHMQLPLSRHLHHVCDQQLCRRIAVDRVATLLDKFVPRALRRLSQRTFRNVPHFRCMMAHAHTVLHVSSGGRSVRCASWSSGGALPALGAGCIAMDDCASGPIG